MLLSGGSWGAPVSCAFRLLEGNPVSVGLSSSYPFWLSAEGHFWFLEATVFFGLSSLLLLYFKLQGGRIARNRTYGFWGLFCRQEFAFHTTVRTRQLCTVFSFKIVMFLKWWKISKSFQNFHLLLSCSELFIYICRSKLQFWHFGTGLLAVNSVSFCFLEKLSPCFTFSFES